MLQLWQASLQISRTVRLSLSGVAEGSQGQEQLHEESRSKEGKTDKSDGPGRKGIVHLETPKHINKQLNLIKGSISIS